MILKNETRVGVLIAAILVLAFTGFRFLKGRRDFDNATRIYAVFDQVGSLNTASHVKINGLTVGEVETLAETDRDLNGIKVTIRLTRDIRIPSNSIGSIHESFGGLSAAVINIEKGNSPTWLRNGDTVQTRIDTPYLRLDNGKQILKDAIDALMENKRKQASKTGDSLP